MKLRDCLLDSLNALPGKRSFHLHLLVSAPRKHPALYPYATSRPRVYAQDILVLVSEQDDTSPGASRVLVSAIEAAVYTLPASASAILYIAKVDSTGQGARPAPTAPLVRALLTFYIDPRTRPVAARALWVHLFARAQAQYLFPNSAEHPAKAPLGDVQLCAWWKRLLTRVARELAGERMAEAEGPPKLYYVLPGMNELEARQALGELSAVPQVAGPQWTYGHPYAQTDVPLPYATAGRGKEKDARPNLGHVIPSFEDDPKTRFMDEIACTTQVDGVRSPKRKRRNTAADDRDRSKSKNADAEEKKEERIHGELGIVGADEFWERMSFRQECVAGAVTGFFVAVYPWPSLPDAGAPSSNPLAPQPGQVSFQMNRRIVASLLTGHEFSTTERAVRATEILEGAIKGLCEGLPIPGSASALTSAGATPAGGGATVRISALSLPPGLVPVRSTPEDEHAVERSGRATPEPATSLPAQLLAPPRTPPPRTRRLLDAVDAGHAAGDDVSPNPFPEPIASTDTYHSFIHGAVSIANPGGDETAGKRKDGVSGERTGDGQAGGGDPGAVAQAVTVLAVRKKRKATR